MLNRLTDSEQWLIANALRAAADVYADDADAAEEAGNLPLMQAFRDQRTQAVALADRFEAAEYVTLHNEDM